MGNVANYVTWDQLIQFCIMLIGLVSLVCMIFHHHKRK